MDNNFTKPEKMMVIGAGSSNGIDTSHFDPALFNEASNNELREELSLRTSDFVFIFLGRIVRDKGINELVVAFKELVKKHPQAKLLLVGYYNASMAQLLPETEKEIEHNERITVLKWQEDVRPFLSISNVLAFPSYREGFPNTVLHASAMEIPSIVCDINGCNEIITDGLNGTIIPVKNTPALQGAMETLLENKEYYTHLRTSSRAPICEKYERTYIWQSLLAEYDKLSKRN
jgi:glycosyltransferase involved in cell wall biosynthesis